MKYILSLFLITFLSGCATTNTGEISGSYYRVRSTDTLYAISKEFNIPVQVIAEKNGISNLNKLRSGQLIFIPKYEVRPEKTIYTPAKTSRPEYVKGEQFIWPVKGSVTSRFGALKNASKTNGIEITTSLGNLVKASRSGQVTFSSNYLKGYGKTIIIDHGDGFQSVYAYNEENLVSENENVKQGQAVAKVGKSGRANEPTLHFEIRKKHIPVDPMNYLY